MPRAHRARTMGRMQSMWDVMQDPDAMFALLCVAEMGVEEAPTLGADDRFIQILLDHGLVSGEGLLTPLAMALVRRTTVPKVERGGRFRRVA
jgi:hypothetical protein